MLEQFNRIFELEYDNTPSGVSYHIELKEGTCFITFQHSKGLMDWIYNFTFPKKAYSQGTCEWYVHRGFLKAWKEVKPYIEKFITANKDGIELIVISGYSHGGALAILCHEWCNYHFPNTHTHTITYGAPRVISGIIPEEVVDRLLGCVKVRNKYDIVPHLPPKFIGYTDNLHTVILRRGIKHPNIFKEHTKRAYIEGINEHIKEKERLINGA